MTTRSHTAAAAAVLAEHTRSEQRAVTEVEGRPPMSPFGEALFGFGNALNAMNDALRPITVGEMTDVVIAIEDDPAKFAERFLTLERRVQLIAGQYDRLANIVQGVVDVPERLDRAESTLSRLTAHEEV